MGAFRINVEANAEVWSGEKLSASRAEEKSAVLPDVGDFALSVTNRGETVYQWDTYRDALEDGELEIRVLGKNDEELDLIPIDRDPIKTATFALDGSKLPKNSPIEVAFCLSEEGLLSVTAVEPCSGRNLEFDVQVSNGLTAEEVERIKRDALTVDVL